jgi:hypothetical protein
MRYYYPVEAPYEPLIKLSLLLLSRVAFKKKTSLIQLGLSQQQTLTFISR